MAGKHPVVTRGSTDDHAEDLMRMAKKLHKGITDRADGYLNGTYDPGKTARKTAVRSVTTALVMLSLLTGIAFSSPADIADEQSAANYRPAPVVMDIDEFVNAPVEDEDDDADEQKGTKAGFIARFRQAVMTMPQSVRLLVVMPLWLVGTGIMTMISFLWEIIFASPLGAFIASLAFGFAILLGLFTATAKIFFPDLSVRQILSKRNLLLLAGLALLLSLFDAAAPVYWHSYPLAAALVKLVCGSSVIGILTWRTGRAFSSLRDRLSFGD